MIQTYTRYVIYDRKYKQFEGDSKVQDILEARLYKRILTAEQRRKDLVRIYSCDDNRLVVLPVNIKCTIDMEIN